eukprot:12347-Chlamydomonas_euryale.AAC.1
MDSTHDSLYKTGTHRKQFIHTTLETAPLSGAHLMICDERMRLGYFGALWVACRACACACAAPPLPSKG